MRQTGGGIMRYLRRTASGSGGSEVSTRVPDEPAAGVAEHAELLACFPAPSSEQVAHEFPRESREASLAHRDPLLDDPILDPTQGSWLPPKALASQVTAAEESIADFSEYDSFPGPTQMWACWTQDAPPPASPQDLGVTKGAVRNAAEDLPSPPRERRKQVSPLPRSRSRSGTHPTQRTVKGGGRRRRKLGFMQSSQAIGGLPHPPQEFCEMQRIPSPQGCRTIEACPRASPRSSRSRSRSGSPFPGPTQMWGGLIEGEDSHRSFASEPPCESEPTKRERSISPTLSFHG